MTWEKKNQDTDGISQNSNASLELIMEKKIPLRRKDFYSSNGQQRTKKRKKKKLFLEGKIK